MKEKRIQRIPWIFTSISAVSILSWFINTTPPDSTLVVVFFFLMLSVACVSFLTAVLLHTRRAFLITLVIIGILFLRYVHLYDWYYTIVLIAIAVALELSLKKR